MQQRLIFNLPLDSVFEMIHQTLGNEGTVTISNKAARLISGKLNSSGETIKIDIQLISKNNKGMLIFNTDIEDGIKFYNLLDKKIRTNERQIEENETINEQDISDFTELVECPYCAEKIKSKAQKCRYCGEFLSKENSQKFSATTIQSQQIPHSKPIKNEKVYSNSLNKDNQKEKWYNGNMMLWIIGIALFGGLVILPYFTNPNSYSWLRTGTTTKTVDKSVIQKYTEDNFKATIGYNKSLMRYTYGDLAMLINYWGKPDEVYATSETDGISSYTEILRCSWSNVLVEGRKVDVNFTIPSYYELTDVSDFTNGELDMDMAKAAKVYSYQTKR